MLNIIQYGSGNVRAFANIFERLNIECQIVDKPENLKGASKIILPGVGAYDQTMSLLQNSGFVDVLNKLVLEDKVPILGVCVGMQVMANASEEGTVPGLGWIDGEVVMLDSSKLTYKPHLPHLGWNSVNPIKPTPLTSNIDYQTGFYFLHSYRIRCARDEDVIMNTTYGEEFPVAVNRENIWGFQFHPEKSHENGVQLLKNFAEHQPC